MTARSAVMEAVEKLNYRVTVGDVATQAGLDLNLAQRELLTLATETGGNLQVAESGEIAYAFAPEFRNILLTRSLKLRIQETLKNIWKWLFFLIRISFGILLIVSILIVVLGIIAAMLALQSRDSNNDNRRSSDRSYDGGGGFMWIPSWGWWGDPFVVFTPDYYEPQKQAMTKPADEMGFLESVFSFLFGDGNPNANLEDRRWREIASVIRNNNGVVIAEQITPYLDDIGEYKEGYEDFMIPVLLKFNGQPQVSDQGTLVYTFPDLQRVASERKQSRVSEYLQEMRWQFSRASSGKIALSIGLGIFYLVGAIFLGSLLPQVVAKGLATGFLGFVNAAFGFLLGYAILFLTIPTVRSFVLQFLNSKIDDRNKKREIRSHLLQSLSPKLKQKLAFAQQFAMRQEVISTDNLAYTTETDLTEQEYAKLLKEMDDSAGR